MGWTTYSALPTRDTDDTNSFADVNQLQTNITSLHNVLINMTSTAGSYTFTDTDGYGTLLVDTTGGTETATLPTLADNIGRVLMVYHKTGTSDVVVNGEGAETISGATTINLAKKHDFLILRGETTEWRIISEKITCQLKLDTYAGYGSTDTRIMRFTNSRENYGNMFSENHSTGYNGNTEGLEITINKSGKYAFIFVHGNNAGSGASGGLSLNSSQLTTDIYSISTTDNLCMSTIYGLGNYYSEVSWTGYLNSGDIIRPHTNAIVPGATAYIKFVATYLGS